MTAILSISDFSELVQLPAQTLRYYHSEGLLVPAAVDSSTGYRSYSLDQVEQALLVSTLRRCGLSVKAVRRAVARPDLTSTLLDEHLDQLRHRRQDEDEAIEDARALVGSWPEVERRRGVAATVLSALAPPMPAPPPDTGRAAESWYDWRHATALVDDTVARLVAVAVARQLPVTGPPYQCYAIETTQQKRDNITAQGPHWVVKLPVRVADELPELPPGVELQSVPARDELSIRLPGRSSTAKHATALARLTAHPLQNSYVDVGSLRHVLHDGATETTLAVLPIDGP